MADQDLTDLVKKMEFGVEASAWDDDLKNVEEDFVKDENATAPRRNARRNIKKDNDQMSDNMSSEAADSLAESMEAIEFVADKFESGVKFEEIEDVKEETTQVVVTDFSRSRKQGEKTSSTTVLATSFDDDVKKYSVFEIPQDDKEYKNMCRKPIGSGNTFCINSKCRIMAHDGIKRASIPKGQLYIQRRKGAIFALPNIGSFSLAESIVDEWKESPQTLETWNQWFRTATNNLEEEDSGFVTSAAFYKEEQVNKLAKEFKTPKRNKVNQVVGSTIVRKYEPLFTNKTKFEEDSAQQYANHLDSNVEIMFEELEKSKKVQGFLANLVQNSIESLEVKLHDIKDVVGRKPAQLQENLDTPDLWSTVGEVASQMEEQNTKNRLIIKNTVAQITQTFDSNLRSYENNALAGAKNFYHKSEDRIDSLNKALGALVLKTQKGFSQTSANINAVRTSRSRFGHTQTESNVTAEDMLGVTGRVTRLELEMSRSKAAEGDGVGFHNLGFQSRDEANAWL